MDQRGVIQSLLELPIRSVGIIKCVKGAVRANHYHKTDWHYCYLLSGSLEYFERPVGSSSIPEPVIIKAGQLFFTPPMVEHAMRFLEPSEFLTFF